MSDFPDFAFYGIKLYLSIIPQIPEKYFRDHGYSIEWDSVGKPSSVVYDHLSRRNVAIALKPPFNEARRADALSSAPIGVASGRVYMAVQSPAPR